MSVFPPLLPYMKAVQFYERSPRTSSGWRWPGPFVTFQNSWYSRYSCVSHTFAAPAALPAARRQTPESCEGCHSGEAKHHERGPPPHEGNLHAKRRRAIHVLYREFPEPRLVFLLILQRKFVVVDVDGCHEGEGRQAR